MPSSDVVNHHVGPLLLLDLMSDMICGVRERGHPDPVETDEVTDQLDIQQLQEFALKEGKAGMRALIVSAARAGSCAEGGLIREVPSPAQGHGGKSGEVQLQHKDTAARSALPKGQGTGTGTGTGVAGAGTGTGTDPDIEIDAEATSREAVNNLKMYATRVPAHTRFNARVPQLPTLSPPVGAFSQD